jgi:hypothetical protein
MDTNIPVNALLQTEMMRRSKKKIFGSNVLSTVVDRSALHIHSCILFFFFVLVYPATQRLVLQM